MMAKRRSYATLQSYLTPPFLESSVRGIYRELMEKIKIYNNSAKENKEQESLAIKTLTVKMGIHRDLGLDDTVWPGAFERMAASPTSLIQRMKSPV